MAGMPKHAARKTRFIAEYATDLCAKAAAIRAGYAASSAKQTGHRLLRQPDVAAAIEHKARQRLARLDVTPERVLQAMARIALADIRGLYRPDETLKDIGELDDATAAGVEAVELVAGNRWRVSHVSRFDKLPSLMLLARHYGLFSERDDGPPDGLAELMAEGRKRAP